jgi:two-component system response regulator FixJ
MPSGQTVFIVDDDDHLRGLLQHVFKSAGFRVVAFASAAQFLEGYAACPESCLLLDLRMPKVGGLELLKSLQRRRIDLPVIIYTGNADVQVAVRAMQEGAFSVIEKPLSGELLIEQVRTAINNTRPQRSRQARIEQARAGLALLSKREKEVAEYLASGLSAAEAAAQLGISVRTVEAHRVNLFRKLQINSSTLLAQIVLLAELGED